MGPSSDRAASDNPSSIIHREILQLAVLIAIAVAAFFLTRAVAASNRRVELLDGAEWYQRGMRELASGDVDSAIGSLQHATLKDRDSRAYVLALARALAAKRLNTEAQAALLTLRESAPEDPDVNLELARLSAQRQDVTQALRYYHNALYSPNVSERADARRRLRLELVHFLLAHQQNGRALAELIVLSTDTTATPESLVELARLFVQAGDTRQAIRQFDLALRVDPDNAPALVGAGEAAFELGDYALARKYLRRAPASAGAVSPTLEVAEGVVMFDPLANRLRSAEQRRRSLDNVAYAEQRLGACVQAADGQTSLQEELRSLQRTLKARTLEPDIVAAGVALVYRIERAAAERCRPPTPRDTALILIGRQHGADER